MSPRILGMLLLGLLASCSGKPTAQGTPCGNGDPCQPGYLCNVDGQCAKLCNTPADCPPRNACEDGECVQLPPECSSDADCTSPAICDQATAICDSNQTCRYIPAAKGTSCDDGDPCTSADQCDGNGTCTGQPMDCSGAGVATCDAAQAVVSVPNGSGSCELGACVYPTTDVPCTAGCAACLSGCLVGSGTNRHYVASGAANPAAPCEICDPAVTAQGYTTVTCQQSTNPCYAATGTCDAPAGAACVGEGCCTYAPMSTSTSCTYGTSGSGSCDGAGHCVGCVAAADCDDSNPCTTDTCDAGACSNTPNAGATCSVGGGTANGTCVTNGVSATCMLAQGQMCSNDADCATGHCADGVCCDSACGGTCETCGGGSCHAIASGTDPNNECPAGACLTGTCNGSGACGTIASGTACGTCRSCNANGQCVDDLSRNSDCGSCQQCASGGQCVDVPAGHDPKNDCALVVCKTGQCDGAGACQNELNGSSCTVATANGTCQSGICNVIINPCIQKCTP